jgi:hypothetical protein
MPKTRALKTPAVFQIKLRLPWNMRNRLVQLADYHARSLNTEIRLKLEDALQHGDTRHHLETIATDIHTNWARFSARFLRMDLGDQLADSVLDGSDLARSRMLAQAIVDHRAAERRGVGGAS